MTTNARGTTYVPVSEAARMTKRSANFIRGRIAKGVVRSELRGDGTKRRHVWVALADVRTLKNGRGKAPEELAVPGTLTGLRAIVMEIQADVKRLLALWS